MFDNDSSYSEDEDTILIGEPDDYIHSLEEDEESEDF